VSSSQVPLWVTILIALVGLLGVLSAQFIAGWREDRRWRREQQREELRWQRDRQRELDNRDYEGRQSAYAQVISAVEAYDWVVYPAIMQLRDGDELSAETVAALHREREELRLSFGLINLNAPQRFNELLRAATLPRSSLVLAMVDDDLDLPRVEELWEAG
jgi:hypothetical protein